MDLVLDKCYLEIDKGSILMNVTGYICGAGMVESLGLNLDGVEPYEFTMATPLFRQLIKEFNSSYYFRKSRVASSDEVYISVTKRMSPRKVTLQSIKDRSEDNGDVINNNGLCLVNLFRNANYLGNYKY